MRTLWLWGAGALVAVACSATESGGGLGGSESNTAGTGTGGSGGSSSGEGGLGFGGDGAGGPVDLCKVQEDTGDTPPPCDDKAPADSFAPMVEWSWADPGGYGSLVSVLVANFDDDDNNGDIDLCDTPDVVVAVLGASQFDPGTMHLLDGATGELKLTFASPVDAKIQPALGDIDGDGIVEVVASSAAGNIMAFEHDGSVKWTGPVGGWNDTLASYCSAISLYDLDADGSVEIIVGFEVFSSTGQRLWGIPGNGTEFPLEDYWCPTNTAADLTGDGKLEVIFGHQVWSASGQHMWAVPGAKPGHPHVANLDGDSDPEIYHATADGMFVLEHNGTVKFGPIRPTGGNVSARCWGKPGAIHDFNGDGLAEIATGTCSDYSMYTITNTATPVWSQSVGDSSGLATGSAFDFLGDGVADAIYADENQIYVFEGSTGMVELTSPRESGTLIEFPVVADVDNDGSAEIIYVSNGGNAPAVTVLGDADSRWIPSRRIWNQHAYHITNVREDGTIPIAPKKSWQTHNTFRVNAQVDALGDCIPAPPN
jgi:hypothetical protein